MKKSRRRFVSQLAALTGAAAVLPHPTFAIHSKRPLVGEIVGHGAFTYRVDKHWGIQDPVKIPVDHCHEMVQDSQGRLLMTTTNTRNNIIIYEDSGRVLKTWGREFPGAHGLTLSSEGTDEFLFITDTVRHKVFKTTLDGRLLMTLDFPQETGFYSDETQFIPTEVAVAPNGDFFMADGYGLNYILHYDSSGSLIRCFGGKGDQDDKFDCCHGILIDDRDASNPTLIITSRSRQQFKRFSMEGEWIRTVSLPSCWICRPVIRFGTLYFAVIVTKSWFDYDGMLLVIDEDDQVISIPGGSQPTYENDILSPPEYDGKTFMNPHDVCVDQDENLYIPQWYSGKTYPIRLERI